jgi:hypothetical protein
LDSSQIWVGTALEKHCEWVSTRSGRHIVTHTRLRCESVVRATASESTEIWVRTLGGHVGRIGQTVHGEADLSVGEQNVVFMRRSDSAYHVTARAQGQFTIREPKSGKFVLSASPNLAELVNAKSSAVKRLAGLELAEAVRTIRAVKP